MPLCSNRFPLPGSPSTCTLDTAIVPLPSFFLLVALVANFILSRRNSTAAKIWIKSVRWWHITYLVLVACQIAMTILELVRLALEKFGIGLLPINTIGLISVFIFLWRERTSRTRGLLFILAVYWFFLAIFETVKVARLHRLEELNPTTTKTSQYPSSDWFLDNAVMLALYFIFFVAESATLFVSRRQRADLDGVYKLSSNV
ncbi:hypothetical protein DFH07DRAFT_820512 [Mycena maculata]|uniref:Uncharacterized protein n=1 Tax=Mycena maculata TaxID=230809 RepID=A0AAD7J3V3_9AGAR|nr:hypothetical protein DFH07DRAFT_820512 [Mycena maculata]